MVFHAFIKVGGDIVENSLPTCTSVCNVVCIHDAPLSYGGLRVTAKHRREAGAEQHTKLTGVPIIIGIDIDIWINCRGGQNDPIMKIGLL